MTVHLLDRAIYTLPEASRLLRVPPATLFWWLDGGTRRSKLYPPVIRPEATGERSLTWAEFVEARYLRAYRRGLGVRLGEIRHFIDELRDFFQVPYPLAHQKPLVLGQSLVVEAQDRVGLSPDWWMFVKAGGQVIASPASADFLAHVDFEPRSAVDSETNESAGGGLVQRIYPLGKEDPTVVIDPAMRFGSPAVHGISTGVLAELIDAGDTIDEVAADYGLSVEELKTAVGYEWSIAS